MHSPLSGEGELRWQPANPVSPGIVALKTVCVCVFLLSILGKLVHVIQSISDLPAGRADELIQEEGSATYTHTCPINGRSAPLTNWPHPGNVQWASS